VGLALDDFGTGFSSLSHLQRFPINQLKIDRSFVGQIGVGESTMVKVVLQIAQTLGLEVVAEGSSRPHRPTTCGNSVARSPRDTSLRSRWRRRRLPASSAPPAKALWCVAPSHP
jgi:hypothetical protein